MRKLILAFAVVVMSLLFSLDTSYAADGQVRLYLNRTELISDVPARIVNDNTLVPIRIISEGVGAEVSWDGVLRQVTVEKDGLIIQLVIDKTEATVNGVSYVMNIPPVIDNDITLLPVRFVTENLGLEVQWDGITNSVFLSDVEDPEVVDANTGISPTPVPAGDDPSSEPESPDESEDDYEYEESPEPVVSERPPLAGIPMNWNPVRRSSLMPPSNNSSEEEEADDEDATMPLISQIQLDGDVVRFVADGGHVEPRISRLSSPERLIIDLPYTALAETVNGQVVRQNGEIVVAHPWVNKIRYALNNNDPSTVRIVLDLNQRIDYSLTETGVSGEWAITLVEHKYKVVLDAGHGGRDPGAIAVTGLYEKDFNLSMVMKIAAFLVDHPMVDVYFTRADDTYVERKDRVAYANQLQADVFISVHANSYTNSVVNGTETHYTRDMSKGLADVIHKHMLHSTGFVDRKVKKSNLQVTRETTMPGILLEVGFLSNLDEVSILYDEQFQLRVAESIAAGILEYLNIQ